MDVRSGPDPANKCLLNFYRRGTCDPKAHVWSFLEAATSISSFNKPQMSVGVHAHSQCYLTNTVNSTEQGRSTALKHQPMQSSISFCCTRRRQDINRRFYMVLTLTNVHTQDSSWLSMEATLSYHWNMRS